MESNGFNKHPENINLKGAPKKDNSWRAIYEEAFDEIVSQTGDKKIIELAKTIKADKNTWKQAIAKVVRRKALSGDIVFITNAQNRMDGPPPQSIENTGSLNLTGFSFEERIKKLRQSKGLGKIKTGKKTKSLNIAAKVIKQEKKGDKIKQKKLKQISKQKIQTKKTMKELSNEV